MSMVPAMHPMRITSRLDWVVVSSVVVTIRGSHCLAAVHIIILNTNLPYLRVVVTSLSFSSHPLCRDELRFDRSPFTDNNKGIVDVLFRME
jgi:hypothetical protein